MTEPLYIGVDCGGTKLRAAASDAEGKIAAELAVPTNEAESGKDGLAAAIRSLVADLVGSIGAARGPIAGIGVGLPFVCHGGKAYLNRNVGRLDPGRLESDLARDWGAPVSLLNDVKCAALGEAWAGAGRGVDPFIFVNVGTGLAAAVYSGGRVLEGAHGAAGEIGYWVIDPASQTGFSEEFGPLEEAMSGVGLTGAYARAAGDQGSGSGGGANMNGDGTVIVSAEEVFLRALRGDPKAAAVVETGLASFLPALANMAILVDPELIVFGGGVSRSLARYAGRIEAYVNRMGPFPRRIVFSPLGGKAGIIGATRLAVRIAEGGQRKR